MSQNKIINTNIENKIEIGKRLAKSLSESLSELLSESLNKSCDTDNPTITYISPKSPGYCTTGYANQHNCNCKYCCYKPPKKLIERIPGSPGYCTTGYANQYNCDCKYCI